MEEDAARLLMLDAVVQIWLSLAPVLIASHSRAVNFKKF